MPELKILSAARERAFKNIPKLNKEDKDVLFLIDTGTRKLLNKISSPVNKVGFLVMRAYFHKKGQFFSPSRFDSSDIKSAKKSLSISETISMDDYKPHVMAAHKKMILAQLNWRPLSDDTLTSMRDYADNLVAVQQNKEDVLFSLVAFCWQSRIEIPSLSKLIEIITSCFKNFDNAIKQKLDNNITATQKNALSDFLDEYGEQYSARELKNIDQAHTQRSLNKNARMLELYRSYFDVLQPLLNKLGLTDDAVKHFAQTVKNTDVKNLKKLRLTSNNLLLHCAFIKDQLYQRHDASADAIIKVMIGHMNKAKSTERKKLDEGRQKLNEDNKTIILTAKELKKVLNKILVLTSDRTLSDAQAKEQIRQLILAFFESQNSDFDETLERVDTSLNNQLKQVDFYHALFRNAQQIQRELGPLIRQIEFDTTSRNQSLLEGIKLFKQNFKDIDESSPIDFLSAADKASLLADDEYSKVDKFRILLMLSLCKALKERSITIFHSYKYKHAPHYLISDEEWANNKIRLMKATNMLHFSDGEAELNKIGKAVCEGFIESNKRIDTGENPFFVPDEGDGWRVKDLEANFSVEKVIPQLLQGAKGVSLQEIMFEADRHSEFFQCFTNRRAKGGKTDVNRKLLFATILSLGTNLGHYGLARATKVFSEKALIDTEKNWMTLNNLKKANDRLVATIQSLPLPTVYSDIKGVLHSVSDATKVVVSVNSLLANFSYKYYGKEQGVSINSFLDEKQSLFCVNVMTSSDREAPYVLEGLINSKDILSMEEIDKHLHSTDTHGYTDATFAGLHLCGVSFAPRIKNVWRQRLYGFNLKSMRDNANSQLCPKKQINKKLILEHWDDILRLMVSMKLGRCSPAQMLKTLSASERDSALYRAFKEFGRLLKTHFILKYVDDEHLRQRINKQLTRVELGQSLAKKIFFGRGGKIQTGTSEGMTIAATCNALLRNMVILWNYLFLSDHCLKIKEQAERKQLIESISSGSVIAWAHINFLGTYEFTEDSRSAFDSTFNQMMKLIL